MPTTTPSPATPVEPGAWAPPRPAQPRRLHLGEQLLVVGAGCLTWLALGAVATSLGFVFPVMFLLVASAGVAYGVHRWLRSRRA
jgi:hypothetical protein